MKNTQNTENTSVKKTTTAKKPKKTETKKVETTTTEITAIAVNETTTTENNQTTSVENQVVKKKKLKVKPKRKQTPQSQAVRIDVDIEKGLTTKQAEERYVDGLSNRSTVKAGKSIFKIITSNTFTFFNLLCLLVIIAYATVQAKPSNFLFVLPFATNLIFAIIQEISAKISIEKLAILQAPNTIVIRDGIESEIPSESVVLDDIF